MFSRTASRAIAVAAHMRPVFPGPSTPVSPIRLPSSTMAQSTVSSVHTNMAYAREYLRLDQIWIFELE